MIYLLSFLLTGQEAGHSRAAYRALALSHTSTLFCRCDGAIFNFPLFATLDTVTFVVHFEISLVVVVGEG